MTRRAPARPASLGLRLAATFFLVSEVAPFAPATFASLAFLPLVVPFILAPIWAQVVALAVVTGVGVIVSTRAERCYGHDAGAIVIDEVAGMMVTFLAVPFPAAWTERLLVLGAGFLLFRIMDIVKPFPAGRAQRLPGGQGIMADDLLAGLYANLALRAAARLFGWN